jgi:flagellar motor component MotA
MFIDILALVVVFVIGSIYAFAINGWQDSIKSFKTAIDKTASGKELKAAMNFFHILEKAYLFFGCFGTIISMINVFRNLEDYSAMGIMFAVSFANLSFALFLIVLCVLPFKTIMDLFNNPVGY